VRDITRVVGSAGDAAECVGNRVGNRVDDAHRALLRLRDGALEEVEDASVLVRP
jgi:hypothetical protein